ncbi:MAG: hypothetical protein HY725_17050 [Candidatus Rokubacteria bacterium]|nr:hypothetical protein [Candidatus Rokubacteria bacterium]
MFALIPAVGVAGQTLVRFEDGLVSAAFQAAPAPQALEAIRQAVGLEVVLPPLAREKTLTLVVERAPLEAFLRRVLEALDLGGFALVYAPEGALDRLYVVDKGRGAEVPAPGPPQEASRQADFTEHLSTVDRVVVLDPCAAP